MKKINCPKCNKVLDAGRNTAWIEHLGSPLWWSCSCGWGIAVGVYEMNKEHPNLKKRRFKEQYGPNVLNRIWNRFWIRIDTWAYKRTRRNDFPYRSCRCPGLKSRKEILR